MKGRDIERDGEGERERAWRLARADGDKISTTHRKETPKRKSKAKVGKRSNAQESLGKQNKEKSSLRIDDRAANTAMETRGLRY